MIKKTLLLIALILPLCVGAQGVGTWKIYSKYSNADKIIETPNRVYFLSGSSLYSYNPTTYENIIYDSSNYLNDVTISDVYYNPFANYLAIAYESGNIDLLFDKDQSVVNLSDIKDAVVNTAHTINDIDFAPGKMIVATAFGVVLFDDKKYEVKESGVYNINIPTATFFGDNIAMAINKDLYYLPKDKKLNNINNFMNSKATQNCIKLRGLSPVNGVFVMTLNNNNYAQKIIADEEKGLTILDANFANNITLPLRNQEGIYFSSGDDKKLYQVDKYNFDVPVTVTLNNDIASDKYGFFSDINKPWKGNSDGIGKYDLTQASFIINPIKPDGLASSGIGRISAAPDGGVIATMYGGSNFYTGDWGDWGNQTEPSNLNYIKNGKVKNITPVGIEGFSVPNNKRSLPWNARSVVFVPENSQQYYLPLLTDGLYKVDLEGNILMQYDSSNSTLKSETEPDAVPVNAIDIDGNGNLWVTQYRFLSVKPMLHVLSNEGRQKSVADKSDWDSYSLANLGDNKDQFLVACKKSNLVITSYSYTNQIILYDSKGKAKIDPNGVKIITYFTDQDNKKVDFDILDLRSLFEDHLGRVWVGTTNGVYVITDPSTFITTNKGHHVKVPRNDGTNYADYLLDGETILCFEEDESGRIWIGTESSGVYLVNGDLTNMEIIENYNTSNSSLLSNKVYAIKCDKNSNEVFFGMKEGLVSLMTDSSFAADDYSNVEIYPNPVRPDYNGWVTIRGLMDKSLVKITDSAGNQIFQGTSNGGMISWDACRSNGEKVPTGVYYVFASQNSSGSSSGDLVGKIMVIK